MSPCLVVGLLVLSSFQLVLSTCPPIITTKTTTTACYSGEGQEVNCTRAQPVGSWAEVNCKLGYISDDVTYSRINCADPGNWDRPVFDCRPDCGRRNTNQGQPLIFGGEASRVGEFPWHVAIYAKRGGLNEQICGGTLISTRIVISAAHCFWSNQHNRLSDFVYEVAAGKHKRAWLDAEDDDQVQRRGVENITIHPEYRGRKDSFRGDIALVRLSAELELTANVNLGCVDWENRWEESQLKPGSIGTVPGWGYTQKSTLSSVLKHVGLPYVDRDTCFNAIGPSMWPLLTLDKFCAGFVNISVSTCPGDGGGGLVFLQQSSNRYFLRGLVSIAFKPATTNDLCYSQSYIGVTRVSNYLRWIREKSV